MHMYRLFMNVATQAGFHAGKGLIGVVGILNKKFRKQKHSGNEPRATERNREKQERVLE